MSDFSTKLNLAFASQDLSDIIYAAGTDNLTPANETTYGSQGQLLPLEKLIPKYAPNLEKLLKADPSIRKSITTPDGHIYSLPLISRNATAIWPMGPMWYNGAWLKKLNVTTLPKTTDEFYDLMMRFKNDDPNGNGQQDEIPLTDSKLTSIRPWMMSAFGMLAQGVENDNGKVVYTPTTDRYKTYLTFMNKMYKNGLLDKDTFSQSSDQKKAKGQANRLGLFSDYFSYFTTGQTEEQSIANPMWQPLTSPVSKTAVVPGSPRITRGTFSITKGNPSPAASMRWVDYFYSEKGALYLSDGPEGVIWKYAKNKDGKQVRVYAKGITADNKEERRGKITPAYGLTIPTLSTDNDDNPLLPTADAPTLSNFSKFIRQETEQKVTPYAKVPFPLTYLTKSEQSDVSAVENDLKTYVEQSEAKFITGVTPMSDWDNYVKTIKGMGVSKYVQVYQKAYDRWAK